MPSLPPLSLYIHVPWCVRKCPYCDFNSHAVGQTGIPEQAYINALLADCRQALPRVQGRSLTSIFIGGGTPSLLAPASYRYLLAELAQLVDFIPGMEITLEANPGTYEHERFQGYLAAGINRLSLGVQSFQDDKLAVLGRVHSATEAQAAITALNRIGAVNVNIDLMYGLPGQSLADALYDLRTAIAYQPSHISWYQLTIEPNTVFYTKPPLLPSHDRRWSMQQAGQQLLRESGYPPYEISAYSPPAQRAQHNLNYWQFGDYLGIGAGAHGKWTCGQTGRIYRHWQTRLPKDYLAAHNNNGGKQRHLLAAELPLEFMMNALRLYDGVPATLYTARTGQPLSTVTTALRQAYQQGLMVLGDRFLPTERGRLFLDDLLLLFAD